MIDKKKLNDCPPPAWLPDWTDPQTYTDHGDDMAAWAWEFLRRNPEYQADFAHYMSVPWCYPGGYPEGGRTPKVASPTSPADDDEMIYFDREPPAANPSETFGEYVRRTGREPERLETALLKKWRMEILRDPASSEPAFHTARDMPPYHLETAWHEMVFRSYATNCPGLEQRVFDEHMGSDVLILPGDCGDLMHVLAFDLRRPLAPQLERAKLLLEDAVQMEMEVEARMLEHDSAYGHDTEWGPEGPLKVVNVTGSQQGKLLGFLRAYDAVWSIGFNRSEIASKLFPGGTSIETNRSALDAFDYAIRKAVRMVDNGYRNLLLWANLPENMENADKKTRDPKVTEQNKKPKKQQKSH